MNPDDILASAGGNYIPPPSNEVALAFPFGVNGVSQMGTYVTPTPPATTITGVVDNGDGTYDVTFNNAVISNPIGAGPSMFVIMFDLIANSWQQCTNTTVVTSTTLTLSVPTGNAGCNFIVVIAGQQMFGPTGPNITVPQQHSIP